MAHIEELAARIEEASGLRREAITEGDGLWRSVQRHVFDVSQHDGWQQLSVEDCCEAIIDYRGRTPPITDSGIPHITSANIRNGRINWNTAKFVTEETYERYMTRGIPQVGDVIFTMEAPLGEVAVIPDGRRFSLAQRTLLLRGALHIVKGTYLAKVLASPTVRERVYARATETTVKGIASKRLRHISLPIPPLSEQQRIVAYLDDVQAQVEVLKRMQSETAAELDALLPSVLDRAFRGEL